MIFTDDDLRRLKERIHADAMVTDHESGDSLDLEEAENLLARMEAAEAYIVGKNTWCETCGDTLTSTDVENKLYEAWLMSKTDSTPHDSICGLGTDGFPACTCGAVKNVWQEGDPVNER